MSRDRQNMIVAIIFIMTATLFSLAACHVAHMPPPATSSALDSP